jgi:hypothetical protein
MTCAAAELILHSGRVQAGVRIQPDAAHQDMESVSSP